MLETSEVNKSFEINPGERNEREPQEWKNDAILRSGSEELQGLYYSAIKEPVKVFDKIAALKFICKIHRKTLEMKSFLGKF